MLFSLPVCGMGSSPRIRGECLFSGPQVGHVGIIPANTGRMVTPEIEREFRRDHPREYGENIVTTRNAAEAIYGSSPRIRGES